MTQTAQKIPLDTAIVKIDKAWKASGIPGLYDGLNGEVSRERARCIRAFLYPKPILPTGKIENLTIGDNLPIRIIHPFKGKIRGTMVYYHGGGWIVGDIDSHEAHAIRIANRVGLVVVSVDYRLAPEHPYPAGITDAKIAMLWVSNNLDKLGGKNNPLTVGGDSAGGNFAAVIAIFCKKQGIKLAAQLLLYPATDLRLLKDPKVEGQYLGVNHDILAQNEDASPIVSNLSGIAPAIIGVGVYDFLYKDNLAYGAALKAAGNKCDLVIYENLNHGFFSYTKVSRASAKAANELCDKLRKLINSLI